MRRYTFVAKLVIAEPIMRRGRQTKRIRRRPYLSQRGPYKRGEMPEATVVTLTLADTHTSDVPVLMKYSVSFETFR